MWIFFPETLNTLSPNRLAAGEKFDLTEVLRGEQAKQPYVQFSKEGTKM